jgi:hypothetical protein
MLSCEQMITGDHADTARTVGGWIGIRSPIVLTGPQLQARAWDAAGTHGGTS